MHNLDILVTSSINGLAGSNSLLDTFMISVTYFGVPCIVLWVALQWWVNEDRLYRRHVAVSAGLAFLIGLLINQIILLFVHRMRPYDAGLTSLLISSTTDPSFPSDHATASFAVAFCFLVKGLRRSGLFLAMAAFVVCFSRIYVGTHYASDVAGGMLTALVANILVGAVYRRNSRVDLRLTRLW